jgi:hypothetical protein
MTNGLMSGARRNVNSSSCEMPFSSAYFTPALSRPDKLFKYLTNGWTLCLYSEVMMWEVQLEDDGTEVSVCCDVYVGTCEPQG